jgi:DNA-binding response OmpR family regulator
LLERRNYEVTAVDNGDDAREVLRAFDAPCIAVLDWMMPGATGIEVCKALRKTPTDRYIYIIVITSRDGEEDITEALAAGADDFIRKPCGVAELFARVRNAERVIGLQQGLARRIEELESALERVRQLRRLIPICMYCKKIRNDTDYWQEIEVYIREHTGADFSHSLCPDCMKTVMESDGSRKSTKPSE